MNYHIINKIFFKLNSIFYITIKTVNVHVSDKTECIIKNHKFQIFNNYFF